MKRLGILMLAMAILMLFGCETAVPEEIAAAPAYDIQAQLEKAERLFLRRTEKAAFSVTGARCL